MVAWMFAGGDILAGELIKGIDINAESICGDIMHVAEFVKLLHYFPCSGSRCPSNNHPNTQHARVVGA